MPRYRISDTLLLLTLLLLLLVSTIEPFIKIYCALYVKHFMTIAEALRNLVISPNKLLQFQREKLVRCLLHSDLSLSLIVSLFLCSHVA